ncbi:MAG: MlaD family protein [Syntrophotaleaceae bacterium]
MKSNDRHQFRYVNETVGLIFLVTLLLFVAAVLGSGRFREWIDPGARLKVVMPEEGLFGLAEGAEVEILGTRAGTVTDIVIDPHQRIYAEVRIEDGMEAFIRRDSQAIIRKRFGVAGAAYLEITRGQGQPLDYDYAVIKAKADRAPTETLTALVDDLHERVMPLIEDAQTAIRDISALARDLQNPQGDLRLILNNLADITGGIARGEGTAGRLIREKEMADNIEDLLTQLRSVARRLEPIMGSLQGTAGNVSRLTGRIDTQVADMPNLSRDLRTALDSLNGILGDLHQTTPALPSITDRVGDATSNLPVLLLQTEQVMVEMEKLLRQLQSNWLFGGSSDEEPRPDTLPPLEARP